MWFIQFVKDYRREVVSAALAALFTLAVSLGLALQKANNDVNFLVKKELNQTLLSDIDMLSYVQNELGQNVEILMNEKMVPDVVIKEYNASKDMPKTSQSQQVVSLLQGFFGMIYVATKADLPTAEFEERGWAYPASQSEIDYELKTNIDRLYTKIRKANYSLREMKWLLAANTMGFLPPSSAMRIKAIAKTLDKDITDIRNEKIQDVRSKIGREVERLRKRREAIKF